jgi:hypothetical protein
MQINTSPMTDVAAPTDPEWIAFKTKF